MSGKPVAHNGKRLALSVMHAWQLGETIPSIARVVHVLACVFSAALFADWTPAHGITTQGRTMHEECDSLHQVRWRHGLRIADRVVQPS